MFAIDTLFTVFRLNRSLRRSLITLTGASQRPISSNISVSAIQQWI